MSSWLKIGTTKILHEWWYKQLKLLLMSLGYKSRAYPKKKNKKEGAHMKENIEMEAEKKAFQLRIVSKRQHWETAFSFYYVIKRKMQILFLIRIRPKGVFSMCYELIHRDINIF